MSLAKGLRKGKAGAVSQFPVHSHVSLNDGDICRANTVACACTGLDGTATPSVCVLAQCVYSHQRHYTHVSNVFCYGITMATMSPGDRNVSAPL